VNLSDDTVAGIGQPQGDAAMLAAIEHFVLILQQDVQLFRRRIRLGGGRVFGRREGSRRGNGAGIGFACRGSIPRRQMVSAVRRNWHSARFHPAGKGSGSYYTESIPSIADLFAFDLFFELADADE
jgi:hypothetical protein